MLCNHYNLPAEMRASLDFSLKLGTCGTGAAFLSIQILKVVPGCPGPVSNPGSTPALVVNLEAVNTYRPGWVFTVQSLSVSLVVLLLQD